MSILAELTLRDRPTEKIVTYTLEDYYVIGRTGETLTQYKITSTRDLSTPVYCETKETAVKVFKAFIDI